MRRVKHGFGSPSVEDWTGLHGTKDSGVNKVISGDESVEAVIVTLIELHVVDDEASRTGELCTAFLSKGGDKVVQLHRLLLRLITDIGRRATHIACSCNENISCT